MKDIKKHLNLLCISDWIINKSEPKADFEIVLNGHGTINLLHRKFGSPFEYIV